MLFCFEKLNALLHIYIYIFSFGVFFFFFVIKSFFLFFLLQAGDLTYLPGIERDKQKIYIYIICIYILFVRWLFFCVLCFVNWDWSKWLATCG